MKFNYFLMIALAGCLFSCERPKQPEEEKKPEETEKPVEPKQRTESLSFHQELMLSDFIPELKTNPTIIEHRNGDYYIALGKQSWRDTLKIGEAYIPAQTSEPIVLQAEKEANKVRSWRFRSATGTFAINEVFPEEFNSLQASLRTTFWLHFSLDEASPYEKVTFSWLTVRFPEWMHVTPYQVPAFELTKEGADVEFNLSYAFGMSQITREDGKHYITIETTFNGGIIAAAEDALDPSAEAPESIRVNCAFKNERLDFDECYLSFSSFDYPLKEMVCEPVPLPAFLSEAASDIVFTGPDIYIHYLNEFPSGSFEGSFPDFPDNPKFQLTVTENYALIPKHDGWARTGYDSWVVSCLQTIFRNPAPDGTLTARMNGRVVIGGSSMLVTPGKEYHMAMDAEWELPIHFDGDVTGLSAQTETLYLDGDKLDAPGAGTHKVGLSFMCHLPFNCTATPVFTLEGEDPVFLDDLQIESWTGGPWFEHVFTPGKDHWKASLYFILKSTKGLGIHYRSDMSVELERAEFTANLKKE